MLRACLESLAVQVVPADVEPHIIVIDNEPEPEASRDVARFAWECPFPISYFHEPKRGIAMARNAACEEALKLGARWIAFIDDDEVAGPFWLAQLMAPEYRNAPILFGRVEQIWPWHVPFWAPEPSRRMLEEGAPAKHLRTGNVRFRSEILATGLRFDETLGLRGGEDQRFFGSVVNMGFEALQTNRAVVSEQAHPARLTYRFMINNAR